MKPTLKRRERLMRIFRGQEVDRPALKLWGMTGKPGVPLHPDYNPVTALALETTDIFAQMGAMFHPYCGRLEHENILVYDEPCAIPNWRNMRTVVSTPLGELSSLDRVSTIGEP